MDLALLGVGQIGGSIARAALGTGFATRVTAWTPSGSGPSAAAADGIVPAPTLVDAVAGADLVVLAAPPLECLDLLDELAGSGRAALRPDVVVTDVASTKVAIVERATARGLRFVGGHPMAGRESSGYASADPELFRDRPWIVVPATTADDAAVERVEAFARALGARPVLRMTALDHDAAAALISHAPLVVSAALVEAAARRPEWATAASIAAGGWAGMTRLARGDASMGAGILATNAAPTADALRAIRAVLDEWIAALEGAPDGQELTDRLQAAATRATTA